MQNIFVYENTNNSVSLVSSFILCLISVYLSVLRQYILHMFYSLKIKVLQSESMRTWLLLSLSGKTFQAMLLYWWKWMRYVLASSTLGACTKATKELSKAGAINVILRGVFNSSFFRSRINYDSLTNHS